jgi:hypothetical protein
MVNRNLSQGLAEEMHLASLFPRQPASTVGKLYTINHIVSLSHRQHVKIQGKAKLGTILVLTTPTVEPA